MRVDNLYFRKEEFQIIYQRIRNESKRLENQIQEIQSQLTAFPKGKIFCTHNGAYFKWFHSDGKTNTYIPKKNRVLAEQLAMKKYLSHLLDELRQEKRALDFYLRHHSPSPGKSAKMLTDMPEYQELLAPYFQPLSQELSLWAQAPYDRNPNHPEHLIHKASSGKLVRSKSEALIDLVLHRNGLPFRYECALKLGESTIYPDFTIRHPHTGETYFWEHFGMMNNRSYSQNTCSKLQLYTAHGIIPTIQLITTYETPEHPLCLDTIEKIVLDYFL